MGQGSGKSHQLKSVECYAWMRIIGQELSHWGDLWHFLGVFERVVAVWCVVSFKQM